MGGIKPQLAEVLEEDIPSEQVDNLAERAITCYKENSKCANIGFIIDAIGIETLREAVVKK